ncbi:MAG: entericidin A/B family lipoprotein [Rhodospirillales bacterium]|nr:entericidin A/B family lipoprotein [Rhodospirillales bacterium]
MRVLRLVAPLLAVLVAAPLLAACNTMAGAGQDMSNAGHAITNGAESAQ